MRVQAFGKARISWEIQEIEKYASRLRQFDRFETPFVNEYGNDNIFFIIFWSGYFNWPEVCGKLLLYLSEKLNTAIAVGPKMTYKSRNYEKLLPHNF